MHWMQCANFYGGDDAVTVAVDDIKSFQRDRSGRGTIIRHKSGGYTLTNTSPAQISEWLRATVTP